MIIDDARKKYVAMGNLQSRLPPGRRWLEAALPSELVEVSAMWVEVRVEGLVLARLGALA